MNSTSACSMCGEGRASSQSSRPKAWPYTPKLGPCTVLLILKVVLGTLFGAYSCQRRLVVRWWYLLDSQEQTETFRWLSVVGNRGNALLPGHRSLAGWKGEGGPEALSGVADGHWSVGAGEEIWAIKLSLFRVFLQQCWQQYITFVHSRDKICRFLYDKVKSFFRPNYEMTISTS